MEYLNTMKTGSSLWRYSAWMLAAATIFVHQAAQACPGCQQANTEHGKAALTGISLGFGFGVIFMLVTVFAVLGGLGYMMYRSCQIIAAQQKAAMAAEDAGRGGWPMPA